MKLPSSVLAFVLVALPLALPALSQDAKREEAKDPRTEFFAVCRSLAEAKSYTAKVTIEGEGLRAREQRPPSPALRIEMQAGRPLVVTLEGKKLSATLWTQGDVHVVRDPSGEVHPLPFFGKNGPGRAGGRLPRSPKPPRAQEGSPPTSAGEGAPNGFLAGRPPRPEGDERPGKRGPAGALVARLAQNVPVLAPHALLAGIDAKVDSVEKKVAADGSISFVARFSSEAAKSLLPMPLPPRMAEDAKIGATLEVQIDAATGSPTRIVLVRAFEGAESANERSITATFELSKVGGDERRTPGRCHEVLRDIDSAGVISERARRGRRTREEAQRAMSSCTAPSRSRGGSRRPYRTPESPDDRRRTATRPTRSRRRLP